MKPLHPCGQSGCPTLTRTPRCPAHTTERYKDPAQQQFYGSAVWKKIRAQVRRAQPICQLCKRMPTQVIDHINRNWKDNRLENLRGLCYPCNNTLTGKQHFQKSQGTKGPFLLLIGLPGVGKTAIRKHLAPMLNAVSVGPDDTPDRWKAVYRTLDKAPSAVVECVVPPSALLAKADKRGVYVVEVVAPSPIRTQRLLSRGVPPVEVVRLIKQRRQLGYERTIEPNSTIDALEAPEDVARQIALQFHNWQTSVEAPVGGSSKN